MIAICFIKAVLLCLNVLGCGGAVVHFGQKIKNEKIPRDKPRDFGARVLNNPDFINWTSLTRSRPIGGSSHMRGNLSPVFMLFFGLLKTDL